VGVINENAAFEFRGEFFNLANHPQFANPGRGGDDVQSRSFGLVTGTSVNPGLSTAVQKHGLISPTGVKRDAKDFRVELPDGVGCCPPPVPVVRDYPCPWALTGLFWVLLPGFSPLLRRCKRRLKSEARGGWTYHYEVKRS